MISKAERKEIDEVKNVSAQTLSLQEYRSAVVEMVSQRIKDKKWYQGVCTDTIEGSYYSGSSVECAADLAEAETMTWDCF